jgi:hypothetical protein
LLCYQNHLSYDENIFNNWLYDKRIENQKNVLYIKVCSKSKLIEKLEIICAFMNNKQKNNEKYLQNS